MLTLLYSAAYHASLMTLFVIARGRFQPQAKEGPSEDETTEPELNTKDANFRAGMAQEKLADAILLAHQAAQILCDHRKKYGWKVTPGWLLQLQAVAAGVLLCDPELAGATTIITSPEARKRSDRIQDSSSAFEEVYRGLLGAGVEVMISRGIARMMYHTATEQKVALSAPMLNMLEIMSATAWKPSDLVQVHSLFPNFAKMKGHVDRERMTELLSKWEELEL